MKKYRTFSKRVFAQLADNGMSPKHYTEHAILWKTVVLATFRTLEKTVQDFLFWPKLYILLKSGQFGSFWFNIAFSVRMNHIFSG